MSNNFQQNLDVVQTRLMQMIDALKTELMHRPAFRAAPSDLQQQLAGMNGPAFIEALLKSGLHGVDDCCDQLKRVDAALCQLDLGLYGLCSDCEEPIEPKLLQDDPCRQRCKRCEQHYRQQHHASRLML